MDAKIRLLEDERNIVSAYLFARAAAEPGVSGDDTFAHLAAEPFRGEQAIECAAKLGYPVLLRPSYVLGGKGMKVVTHAGELAAQIESARREAAAGFGDEQLLIERYLERPRHIEIQIFADAHGRCVHLFERDCSLQRRHQKVLEEAPAPGMTPELRARMGAAAVEAARAATPPGMLLEVECDTLAQLAEAMACGVSRVLLDNMDTATLAEGVRLAHAHGVAVEASGNVNLDTIVAIAATGVDYISIGKLTHSAPAVDIGLDEA